MIKNKKQTNDKTLDRLRQGYRLFYQTCFIPKKKLFKTLAQKGQSPRVLVIGCSDSRVDPSMILNADPGHLFVIRNVANLIPPFEKNSQTYHGTSAALEFGVCQLNVEHIIVMGHTQCGGMQTLLQNYTENSKNKKNNKAFIHTWMKLADSALEQMDPTLLLNPKVSFEKKADQCGQAVLLKSLEHLETFPFIVERLAQKKLALHAWQFSLRSGRMHAWNARVQRFRLLKI